MFDDQGQYALSKIVGYVLTIVLMASYMCLVLGATWAMFIAVEYLANQHTILLVLGLAFALPTFIIVVIYGAHVFTTIAHKVCEYL